MLRTGQLRTPQGGWMLHFDADLSINAGRPATGDPGVSPDRTFTGRLP